MHPLTRAEINAQNAQHSTGPKTPEGKAVSSQNAVKHGLTAADPVVRPGEEDDFQALKSDLLHQCTPIGALEKELFDQILHASWKMRRIRKLEYQMDAEADIEALLDDKLEEKLAKLARHYTRSERIFQRALNQLKQLQTERMCRWHMPTEQRESIFRLADSCKLAKQTHLTWLKPAEKRSVTLGDILAEVYRVEKLQNEANKSASEAPAQ